MKKFYSTLSLFLLMFLTNATTAQICDAQFSFQTNGNTVYLLPVMSTDSFLTVSHTWYFGDGNSSTQRFPSHPYANCGTYTVFHEIIKRDSLGQIRCYDSTFQNVVIQCNTPCNLIAGFTHSAVQGAVNTISFTNTTNFFSPTDSVKWSFGDSSFSSSRNPVHTFPRPGQYRVCLWVKNNIMSSPTPCWSETCQTITVGANNPCNIIPTFSYQINPQQPNVVSFVNTSMQTNAPLVTWRFGDSTTATGNSVTHTYANPGTYWVCMRVTVSNTCSRDTCFPVTIGNGSPCNVNVNFGWNATGRPGEVVFNNTSTNFLSTDSLFWTFGDGNMVIGNPNPSHIYSNPGAYVVCLRVVRHLPNGMPPCVRDFCRTITIPPFSPCIIYAAYTVQAVAGQPNTYVYTNTSLPVNSTYQIRWNFGDSTGFAYGQSVQHTFNNPGSYWVCMNVIANNTCAADTCGITVVQDSATQPCNLRTNFTWSYGGTRAVIFQGNVMNSLPGDSIRWNFGDGSFGNTLTATHTYANAGTYRACLIAKRPGTTCVSETCRLVSTLDSTNNFPCDSARARFSFQVDPVQSNKVRFVSNANRPILQTSWTISSLNGNTPPITLNQFNPTYVFDQSGTYQVCMRATLTGGCFKEYCDSINIPTITAALAYPNPATTQVTVSTQLNGPSIIYGYIYNAQNILVSRQTLSGYTGNNLMSFNIGHLPSGFYTIRLYYNGRSVTTRFQKF
jgi:PKD repeat protein